MYLVYIALFPPISNLLYISYLLAASSFFRSSNSSRETSFGKELLLVHAEVAADSEVSLLVVDIDLRISTGLSTGDPFGRLGPLIEAMVVESVVTSDMTTSFADPVDEAESVEDTDSIDDLRLAESSLLLDITTLVVVIQDIQVVPF